MLLVSAIVPVFNGARFLSECLESALIQAGQGIEVEVIVVDDGSSDGTFELASRYASRHPDRLRVIRQQRGGPASARNRGVREARGEWLAFLDCDDTWLPGKLERQIALARPGTGLIYTDRCTFGRGQSARRLSDEIALPRGDVFERLLQHNFITASSVLMRHDAFERVGGFCEYIYGAEDWDLWLRYAHEHPIELCPEPLTRYRRHPGGISNDSCALFLAQCKVRSRALALPRGQEVDRVALRRAMAGPEVMPHQMPLAVGLRRLRALCEEQLLPRSLHLGRGASRALREATSTLLRRRASPAVPTTVARGVPQARAHLQGQQ